MKEFTLRPANLQKDEEIDFIAKIDMTIPAKFDPDFPVNEQMIQDRIKFLKSCTEADFFEIAEDTNKNIIAFHLVKKVRHFEHFAGRIDTLWVSPDYRGCGVATALKKNAEKWAMAENLDHLHTWVHVSNTLMTSMNKRMGYHIEIYKMRKNKNQFLAFDTNANKSNNQKIPTLVSERLTLRPFRFSDAKEVQRMAGHPKVAATTMTIPHPYLDGVAEEWIAKHQEWFNKGQSIDWAIELTASQQLIGNISFGVSQSNQRAELGYWIGEEFWNKGYCTEAARLAIRYGFEVMKLNKITSRYMSENPASGKVMKNAGMVQEGVLAQEFYKNDRFVDVIVYGLTRDQF